MRVNELLLVRAEAMLGLDLDIRLSLADIHLDQVFSCCLVLQSHRSLSSLHRWHTVASLEAP